LEELRGRGLLKEGDGVVVSVEEGRVSTHEDVTDDHVVEASGGGGAHDSHQALSVAELLNLDDVVGGREGVGMAINSESDVGEVLNS